VRIFWWRQKVGTGDTSTFAVFSSNSLREGVCVTGPQIPLHPSTVLSTVKEGLTVGSARASIPNGLVFPSAPSGAYGSGICKLPYTV